MKALTLALPLTLAFAMLAQAQLVREEGAIYLEDVLPPGDAIFLGVAHETSLYYTLEGRRVAGTLELGYDAELLAISDKAYLVKAKAKHAVVKGWVTPKAFKEHKGEEMKKSLKALYERYKVIQDLIAKNQVALGMTVDEVKKSLGEPNRTNSTLDAEGKRDSLEFITYESVLQPVTRRDINGFLVRDYVRVKVETGKTTIDFEDDVVVSIKNSEGAPNLNSGVTIAPPVAIIY